MNNVIVGTAGHVDHGKTCLIKALTGVDTDRLKEEKQRGITIELGFADLPAPDGRHIGIIDVPGHEKFLKNMLAGIGGVDLALLVVAADEGVMPQTVEHFEILKMLHIRRGIVAVTKADLVDQDWMELVSEDIRELTAGTFLEGAEIIPVSSYTGQNIDLLRQQILELSMTCGQRRTDPSLLRIPVDRVFTIGGFGTVITGTLMEGQIHVGDTVQLYPGGKTAKVRGLQVHGETVQKSSAGMRTAVNLADVKKEEILRGDVLAAKESLHKTMMLDVKISMFDHTERTLVSGSRLHLNYGSAEVLCKAVLLSAEALERGESGYAQLRLEEEIAVRRGDRFILRFYSPVESMGGGIILDVNPKKHKRFQPEILEALAVREKGGELDVLEQTLLERSSHLEPVSELAILLGWTEQEVKTGVEELCRKGVAVMLSEHRPLHLDYVEQIQEGAESLLAEYHGKNPINSGMKKEEFRSRLSTLMRTQDSRSSDLMLRLLLNRGVIRDTGNEIALSSFQITLSGEQEAMKKRLEQRYLDYGVEILELSEAVSGEKDRLLAGKMVETMAAEGILVRLSHQNYMHKTHWDHAVELLRRHVSEHGSITLAEFRDLLSTSRKYAVMILEYLDENQITRKEGEARILIG